MYSYSGKIGLQVVLIQVLEGQSICYLDTWTLTVGLVFFFFRVYGFRPATLRRGVRFKKLPSLIIAFQ